MKKMVISHNRARGMYICQATLEHLIALLVSGSFLATLTGELGFSDSTTGILSSVISLGCLFQLLSLTIRYRRTKKLVIAMSITNQLLFASLYAVPFLCKDPAIKATLFIIIIVLAYLLYNIAHPRKIAWLMSFVDDSHRGIFTANKEIVSLVCGMLFTFLMGNLMDHFAGKNQVKTGLFLSAGVILTVAILHTLSMLFVPSADSQTADRRKIKDAVLAVVRNRRVLAVAGVFILYNIANNLAVPFFGSYQIHELGFSLVYVAFLSTLGSIARILFSRKWGKYADRHSFARAMEKCLLIKILALLCVVFSTPQTGTVTFLLYYILQGIAMGGINNAMINLVFDNASNDIRSDALAVCQAIAGLCGFLTTLAVSPVVEYIQKNHNTLFGISLYAQNLLALAGAGVALITVVFLRKFAFPYKKD